MRGLLQHLRLTLRLNFRSPQALVYGYLVPVFFLIAFGSIFKTAPPLWHELGQLLTITTLGGACFGMPTAMVAERERGVWRRYRVLPASTSALIVSTMLARFVLVAAAAAMQIGLAKLIYGMPMPLHPVQLFIAFGFVCFAFLGMGLAIAMLAENVPAVQALGQTIFLPMIIIGGVGVPLAALPVWAQHVAGFLPGRYAVDALQACVSGPGLGAARFSLAALLAIGLAALLAGGKLFRWDVGQRLTAGARAWAGVAILGWAAVGLTAEFRGKLSVIPASNPIVDVMAPPATQAVPRAPADWQSITAADTASITYDDLEPDESDVTPIASSLDNLPEQTKAQMDDLAGKLADWTPGQSPDPVQRVQNLLAVAAIPDILQDPNEAYIPLVVFGKIKAGMPTDQLIKVLTWIALHPDRGTCPAALPDLGFAGPLQEDAVRQRVVAYGRKLLARLLGKVPGPTTEP
jgi:ABC-2 type transport system permease protein